MVEESEEEEKQYPDEVAEMMVLAKNTPFKEAFNLGGVLGGGRTTNLSTQKVTKFDFDTSKDDITDAKKSYNYKLLQSLDKKV